MGRALVVIAISSAVAVVAMAAIVWSMVDHREGLEFQETHLDYQGPEARDYSNLNSSPSDDTGAQSDRIVDAGAPLRSPATVTEIQQCCKLMV